MGCFTLEKMLIVLTLIGTIFMGNASNGDDSYKGKNFETKEVDRNKITQKAIKDLDAASNWVITEGLVTYHQHHNPNKNIDGGGVIADTVYKNWFVNSYAQPSVNENDNYFRQTLKASGVTYDVWILHRHTLDDKLYEYWMVKIWAEGWAGEVPTNCRFILTSADAHDTLRNVIKEEKQFFESYQIDESHTFSLPLDDLSLLADMEAAYYPACFVNSDLKDYKILYHKEEQRYEKRKLNMLDKIKQKLLLY